jgi:hypothetical protein
VSLYREPGKARRRRRATAACIAAVVVLIAVVAVLLVAGGDDTPSGAERASESRAAAAKVLDGLELLEIEYAQAVEDGRVVEPTEYQAAQADVRRALDAFGDVDGQAQPGAYARGRSALAALEGAVRRRVEVAEMKILIARARSAIEPLAG